MAALLVSLVVMSVLMAVAMPAWRHMMQREREAELIFRGEQYARAIGLFQRKFAGAFPPSIDLLLDQKFLRKRYRDPMVPDGQFQVLYQTASAAVGAPAGASAPGGVPQTVPGASSPTPGTIGGGPGTATGTAGPRGAVIGVVSKSTKSSIRLYNGRSRYSDWQFVYTEVSNRGGAAAGTAPAPGQGGSARPGSTGQGQGGVGRPGAPSRAPSPGMAPPRGNPGSSPYPSPMAPGAPPSGPRR